MITTDDSETKTEPHSLEEWAHVLRDYEMPIFSSTVQNIHTTLNDDKKGAMELAAVVLNDPSLTAKLLKMSNSIYYNPTRQKMITVSRAIVILGLEVIRELTLACSFFESILSSPNKEVVNEEIAHAIHAAVQAKAIAVAAKDPSPEEVFIATLLNNIGRIAFWCFSEKQAARIEKLMQTGLSQDDAEKQVLNFTLAELDVALNKAWNLGGLIEEAIDKQAKSKDPRVGVVRLGYEIVAALKEGKTSNKMKDCLKKVEAVTKQPVLVINQQIQKNTEAAVNIASHFGAHEASKYIQRVHTSTSDDEAIVETTASEPVADNKQQVQFQILQDIAAVLSGKIDINLLLEMVVEGIQGGIGMDRTVFSLLMPDRKNLREKFSLGWRKSSYAQKIFFNVSSQPVNLFAHALASPSGLWLDPVVDAKLYTRPDLEVIGKSACFLMPICAGEKAIGVIYGDRALTRRPLDKNDFNAFKHFVQQANIGLTLYQIQGRK